jgi:hypothetical protein
MAVQGGGPEVHSLTLVATRSPEVHSLALAATGTPEVEGLALPPSLDELRRAGVATGSEGAVQAVSRRRRGRNR